MKLKAKSGSSLDALIACARKEAVAMEHSHIGTEHLLIALAGEPSQIVAFLKGFGATADACRQEASRILGGNGSTGASQPNPQLTPRARHILALSAASAQEMAGGLPSPTHLLLAILEFHEGVAFDILLRLGVDVDKAEAQLREIAEGQREDEDGQHATAT